MDFTISLTSPEHFGKLRTIELAAFETLRNAGAVTGEAGACSLEELSNFSRNGLLITAYTPDSVPVGFVAGKVELGFNIVEGHARPPHLVNLIAEEISMGFIPARRVAMWVTF